MKSRAAANSETERENVWQWYTNDAYTRLEDGGRIVLIGTRWHEDDLIGRALNSDDEWHVISLPALAEEDDPLGRQPGEALWPEKYPVEELERRQRLDSRGFVSLFQQRPAPAEGALLKDHWWRYYDSRPALDDLLWVLQSWDTAFKTGQDNDFSACVTLGTSATMVYVLDVWQARVEFPDLKRAVASQYLKWRPDEIVVEDKASGQSLIQELKDEIALPQTWNSVRLLPIVPYDPGSRDKVERVNTITPYVEGGRVLLPAPSGAGRVQPPWVDGFLAEARSFPLGKHDDQVDAFAVGLLRLLSRTETMAELDPAQLGFADLPGYAP